MTSDPVARALRSMLYSDPTVNQVRLSEALGKDQGTISRYCQGAAAGGLNLPALLVPAVTAELGHHLISELCRMCGGRFVVDDPITDNKSCLGASIQSVQHAAAYQVAAADAEADGRISLDEHRRLLAVARALYDTAVSRIIAHEKAIRESISR